MIRCAVMGNPIEHSLSPVIHHLFAKQTGHALVYDKILIEEASFEQQVKDFFAEGGRGLNITLPCKQRAFAMSDGVSERCVLAKAANTLWMTSERLHADNTDGVGLLRDLSRNLTLSALRILVLGAGGAARGILGPLFEANPADITVFNRSSERARALQLDFPGIGLASSQDLEHASYDLVINATSASFQAEILMLPNALLANQPMCYDLSYSRSGLTPFVAWAKALKSPAMDGLGMLVEQAAIAFWIWHGVMPDTAPVLEAVRRGLNA